MVQNENILRMEASKSLCENITTNELETNDYQGKDYYFANESHFDEWWANSNINVGKKSFGEQEEEIFKHSVILKSFRNEYETDSLFPAPTLKALKDGKIKLDKQDTQFRTLQKQSVEILVPGYNPNSFIPNTSCLNYHEMIACLGIVENGGPQNKAQLKIWMGYKPKLEEEQQLYIQFAKDQWKFDNYKRHTILDTNIKQSVDLLWKARLEKVYTLPKFYAEVENISLTPTGNDEVNLVFLKRLESIGRPARYHLPNLWTFVVNVKTVADSMKKPRLDWSRSRLVDDQAYYKETHKKLIDSGYHSDISKDKIAERLAKENGVNIVMSSSAFTHLVNNRSLGFSHSWNLPVTVTDYETDRGLKKIVYIDKKLPAVSMTAVERMKYYSKMALKELFLNEPTNYRDLGSSIYDADSLETFGIETSVTKSCYKNLKKQKKSKCYYCKMKEKKLLEMNSPPKEGYNSDSGDSTSFFIDVGEEEDVNRRSTGQEGSNSEVVPEGLNKNLLDNASSASCTCRYEWVEEKVVSLTDKSKKLNYRVMYNLWEFTSSNSHNYMSKNCSKDLKVIIRTTERGQEVLQVKEPNESVTQIFKLSPKLEYQTEFGAEAVTLKENLDEWAALYIRPFSNLARVRLDGMSGEIIQIQRFHISDLEAECQRLYQCNPKERFSSMHSILVKLSVLPAGLFRLMCAPRLGTFVQLLRSVNSGGTNISNLHLQYNSVDPTVIASAVSPFPALDPSVLTPTFQHFKRVPCTFAPKKTKPKKSLLKDNSAINPPVVRTAKNKRKRKARKKKKKH